jgi:hypothetical protein
VQTGQYILNGGLRHSRYSRCQTPYSL